MPKSGTLPENHQARDGNGNIISATEGIFPICEEIEKGKLRVIGTGFYITRYGLFMTARHVFDSLIRSPSQKDYTLRIFHDTGSELHIRNVRRFCYSHHADLALGEADNEIERFPENPIQSRRAPMTTRIPTMGEKLATFAFPRNHLLDFTGDRTRPVQMFADTYRGEFTCVQEPGKYDSAQIARYQTTVVLESGASGAPVFDVRGKTCAVACSSLEGEKISFLTPICHALSLNLNMLQLPKSSWEYKKLPLGREHDRFTIAELASYEHIDLEKT